MSRTQSTARSAQLTLTLRVDPEAAAVRLVRGQLRSLLQDHGFAAATVEALLLGLDEALMNAVFHGGSAARREPVELTVELHADRIAFLVADRGEFSARDSAPQNALPEDDSESGRGMFLMRSTMDEVTFEPREGGGTRVRLVKRR